MDTIRSLRRAAHHQIRDVGGQDGGRQLEGPEPHCQCQAKPRARPLFNAGTPGHCRHNRHQQRDTPHIGRHHKRQRIAEQHHAADHQRPGVGQPRRERPGRPVRQPGFAYGDPQHKAAEYQPEGRGSKAAKNHLRRRDFGDHRCGKKQLRGHKLRQ